MSYTDEVQLQHLINLGALVDSSVIHQEYKEPQVPSATELCSVLPHLEIEDPSITTTQAEEPSITTTKAEEPSITTIQAAEIEAHSDLCSNPLPPTKSHSKRLQALPKTQAGRVLQVFQSSYSLRNPTGQGLIPQGGIPNSAKDWNSTNGEQIQENEKSTDNVPVTQEKTDEQPLFRDEEQLESETHVPTEEAPITSGSQQTLPAAEDVSQALDNCMFIIRESLKICGRKKTDNEDLEMVYKALPSFIVDCCQSGE
ncbi:expressed protein [Phakopsora pachyrhizi]|uniref:Expressed protein n=1 Tax=Phakopsora pachyrhizi TaxID=170000 RepID=A0AAV0ADA4_PHAPC|nr:expressed protein [Phakopsora pachyrhizi]